MKKRDQWYLIGAIAFLFIASLYLYSTFVNIEILNQSMDRQTELSEIREETNKRIDTFNADVDKYNELVTEFRDMKTIEEVNRVVTKIVNEYNFVKSHNEEFLNFIESNKNDIKDAGYDTYELKKQITDFDIMYQNFLDNIKTFLDNYDVQSEEQRAIIANMLKLFIGLI